MSVEDRVTTLELRYMEQADLVETLNAELVAANDQIARLLLRVGRLERQLEEHAEAAPVPVDKPPHY